MAAIAGLAVIAVIERDGLLSSATTLGEHLVTAIDALGHPLITGVRGRGLLRGVTLAAPVAAQVADAALDAGFIINAPRPDVLRLAPPLIITAEQLDGFVAVLPELLDAATTGSRRSIEALPGRRRPEPRRAGRGPRARRAAEGGPVRCTAVSRVRAASR